MVNFNPVVYVRSKLLRDWGRFWEAVDDEKVGVLQGVLYLIIVLDCLYNMIWVDVPVQIVEGVLVGNLYLIWLGLGVLGPLVVLASKCVDQHGPHGLAAMWAQFTGDLTTLACLSTYIVATLYSSWWGKGNFAGSLAFACSLAVTLFVVRDLRRIAQRDEWVEVCRT